MLDDCPQGQPAHVARRVLDHPVCHGANLPQITGQTDGMRRVPRISALRAAALAVGLLVTVTVVGSPSPSRAATDAFASVDASMRERVRNDGLPGGVVLVVRDGSVIHEASVGDVDPSTVIPIASASKWLTAATIMTLVDEGKLALDDSVAKYLPEFKGGKGKVRVRHLLSHTTGLPWNDCIGDPSTTTEVCIDAIAEWSQPGCEARQDVLLLECRLRDRRSPDRGVDRPVVRGRVRRRGSRHRWA